MIPALRSRAPLADTPPLLTDGGRLRYTVTDAESGRLVALDSLPAGYTGRVVVEHVQGGDL